MIKLLQSEITASVLGMILFCVIIAMTWAPPADEAENAEVAGVPKPRLVLDSLNPEMQQVMEELQTKKAALDEREAKLRELEVRLASEREEMDVVTQAGYRIQQQFDASILKVREAEMANLKKLAKYYLSMSPEGAAATFKTMDDDSVAKILRMIRDAEASQILDVMAKLGPEGAKKVARITERMRVAMNETNAPPASETPATPKTP